MYYQPVTSEVIPDRATAYGERVRRRLSGEMTIWLTTVGRDGTPQPNPVGFVWDGGDGLLTYSQADARRLANIRRQPRVSLNFDSNGGTNIVVFTGTAEIQAAAAAGQLVAQRGTFALAAESFGLAVGLLPQLASRRLSRGDAQRWLAEFRGLASQAASCAVRAGDVATALTLFETGRGVLLSQALDLGGELAELEQADPDAAQRLERLRAELDGVTSDPRENPAGLAERRRRAATELDDLIADVRAMPGLAGFMLPPSAAELLEAASDGAVVLVNASPWGCQAIALHDGELMPIPLDALDADEAAQQAGALTQAMTVIQDPGSGWGERNQAEATMVEILGWLWDVVGQPVLHALGHDQMPVAAALAPGLVGHQRPAISIPAGQRRAL